MLPWKRNWMVVLGWLLVLFQGIAVLTGPVQGKVLTAETIRNVPFVVGFFIPAILGAVFLLLGYLWYPKVKRKDLAPDRAKRSGSPRRATAKKRR